MRPMWMRNGLGVGERSRRLRRGDAERERRDASLPLRSLSLSTASFFLESWSSPLVTAAAGCDLPFSAGAAELLEQSELD